MIKFNFGYYFIVSWTRCSLKFVLKYTKQQHKFLRINLTDRISFKTSLNNSDYGINLKGIQFLLRQIHLVCWITVCAQSQARGICRFNHEQIFPWERGYEGALSSRDIVGFWMTEGRLADLMFAVACVRTGKCLNVCKFWIEFGTTSPDLQKQTPVTCFGNYIITYMYMLKPSQASKSIHR